MRVAIPSWNGWISPVLDVAGRLVLVDVEGDAVIARSEAELETTSLPARCKLIRDLHVDVLVCGAASQPLEEALTSNGVRVIARRCGVVEDVLRAFLAGRLTDEAFLMPGCCRRRRLRHGRASTGW